MTLRLALRAATTASAAAVLLSGLLLAGCFDDECGSCPDGYSCYYGVCLSRGYCPLGDPHSEPHCIERDASGTCIDERGLCDEGYFCKCTFIRGDGSCRDRACVDIHSDGVDIYDDVL